MLINEISFIGMKTAREVLKILGESRLSEADMKILADEEIKLLTEIHANLQKELKSCEYIKANEGGLTEYGTGRYDLVKKLLGEHFS